MNPNKLKRNIEKDILRNLIVWYKKVARETASQIIKGGSYGVEVTREMKSELTEVIEKHYDNTIKNSLPKGMDKNKRKVIQDTKDRITQDVLNVAQKRLKNDIDLIADSTQKVIRKVIWQIIVEAEDEISNKEISRIYRNVIKSRFENKAKADAITETNWLSEQVRRSSVIKITEEMIIRVREAITLAQTTKSEDETNYNEEAILLLIGDTKELSKYNERKKAPKFAKEVEKYIDSGTLVVAVGALTIFSRVNKRWNDAGDQHVRPTHTEASRTGWIPVDEPFSVGAYQMMYPSDDSLGAGAEEIVYCRCWLTYD